MKAHWLVPSGVTMQASSRAFRSRAALPSEWDRRHYGRHQQVQDYLKVDGLAVKYVGPGESDAQAATIFADKPVPHDVALYYFEVTIVNKGDSGYIGECICWWINEEDRQWTAVAPVAVALWSGLKVPWLRQLRDFHHCAAVECIEIRWLTPCCR